MLDLNSPEARRLESLTEDEVFAMTPGERIALMWPLTVLDYAKRGIDVSNLRVDRTVFRLYRRMPDGTEVEIASSAGRGIPSSDPADSADPTD